MSRRSREQSTIKGTFNNHGVQGRVAKRKAPLSKQTLLSVYMLEECSVQAEFLVFMFSDSQSHLSHVTLSHLWSIVVIWSCFAALLNTFNKNQIFWFVLLNCFYLIIQFSINHFFFSTFSIEKVSKITSPVLIIHGTEDEVIDFSHGLALFERCPKAVEPLWVEGAGHNDIELYSQYLERLRRFIGQELAVQHA